MGPVESRLKDDITKYGTICLGLIDNEDITSRKAAHIASACERVGFSGILIGGSTATDQLHLHSIVGSVKGSVKIPTILFPGNVTGIVSNADAIFFSSLLNSDNPYFITEAQALAAMVIKKHRIEPIPMGYIIVGQGGATGFIGRARGIPTEKPVIGSMYALAGQYMGMRFIYLEGGSGATSHVPIPMISHVRKTIQSMLIVGGGIRTPRQVSQIAKAGADILVIGNLLESQSFESTIASMVEEARRVRSQND